MGPGTRQVKAVDRRVRPAKSSGWAEHQLLVDGCRTASQRTAHEVGVLPFEIGRSGNVTGQDPRAEAGSMPFDRVFYLLGEFRDGPGRPV